MRQTSAVESRCARFMRVAALAAPAMLWVISTTGQAAAQGGWPAYVADFAAASVVPAALSQPYGRAFVAEFGKVLTESADPQCLAARGITKKQVAERGRAVAVQRGIYLWNRFARSIDRAAYRSYLRARLGTEGVAEFERLRDETQVRAYIAAEEPARHALIVLYIFETMERHNTIHRIKLVRGISPYSTSDRSLMDADPTEKVEATLKEMVARDTSGVLLRYREMAAAARKPLNDAVDGDVFRNLTQGAWLAGPDDNADGFKDDLAALCVR
jgi:hypothetical protein